MAGAELATTADLDKLRAELKAEITAVQTEIELLRRDLTIRLGSMSSSPSAFSWPQSAICQHTDGTSPAPDPRH
jgi:hypothetical protein